MLNVALCGDCGYFTVLPFFRKCVEKWKQMKDKEYNYVRSLTVLRCAFSYSPTQKPRASLNNTVCSLKGRRGCPLKYSELKTKGLRSLQTHDGVSCCSMLTRIRTEVLPNSGEPDDT